MRTSKHIEQLAHNIHFRPDEKTDERILAEAEAALSRKTFPDTEPKKMRIIIMRNPIIRIAAAAVVVIACLIGLSLWRTTGSGIALADVLARIEQVKAVRYKWTYTMAGYTAPNKPYHVEIRATSVNSGEYGTKSNWEWLDPNGGESTFAEEYFLPQKKMAIDIVPKEKKYTRKEFDDGWVERMQKANPDIKDPLACLRKILKTKYDSLGKSTMDGVEVAGFRTTDPNLWGGKNPQTDVKLWVDVKTLLPVRYDIVASVEVDEMGDRLRHHIVTHDFQWDVYVDPAAFEPPPIPDGYEVADQFPNLADEETAIQGLRQCVELLGHYPERIAFSYLWSGFEKSEAPAALRLKEAIKGLTGLEKDYKKMDALKPMRFLNKFYLGLASRDSAYYGKTVTPKDTGKVLLRWKLSENEYRVIFGDLHAQTVTAEALAKLEKNLPK